MNFLKNLFGGGASGGGYKDDGIYIYVQPRGCEEVIQVRLHPANDLSEDESSGGYFANKTARGNYRCFQPIRMKLYFDKNRGFTGGDVDGGKLVDAETYDAWQTTLAERKRAAAERNAAVDAANNADTDDDDA